MTAPTRIETARLVLRELEDRDFEAVHDYAIDPEVVRFMPWGPNTEADTLDFLARARAQASARPRLGYELAVTRRADGQLIGAIGLHRETADADEAMLGYCFSRRAWGLGFATEAGSAMLKLAFEGMELSSVWAGCDVRNQGSVRVLEKLGMVLMSRHAHEPEGDDEGGESFMFRISKEEWTRLAGPRSSA